MIFAFATTYLIATFALVCYGGYRSGGLQMASEPKPIIRMPSHGPTHAEPQCLGMWMNDRTCTVMHCTDCDRRYLADAKTVRACARANVVPAEPSANYILSGHPQIEAMRRLMRGER